MEQLAPQNPAEMLAQLERRLQATPRAARPLEHAALRFQIGMAYAELPTGDRQVNLSRAVASYQQAAGLFTPNRHPVEHARVRIGMGAALRELGQHREAVQSSEVAISLLESHPPGPELGAALNNLGLARSDLGEHDAAIEALRRAVDVFTVIGETRQRVLALHNLGQARAAAGDETAAVQAYERGIAEADAETMPYQWALLHHSLGVSLMALGEGERAAGAFRNALRVFTRHRYPFQYALAKNNLGLASAQVGDVTGLRQAVAAYEDALRILDPRMHRPQWEQAYRNLEQAEAALAERGEGGTRAEHFARLLAALEDERRLPLLRERISELLALPDPRRTETLAELQVAIMGLADDPAHRLTAEWLDVLMELPNELFLAGLRGCLVAHQHLDDERRRFADEVLDMVITEELLAPQRIRVRDTLTMLGWERPT